MAFNPLTLFTSVAVMNATSYGRAPAIHTYRSDDNLATVATPGYFPDFFGVSPDQVRVNDILVVMASDIRLLTVIISLEPVILTAFTDFPTNLVTETITTQSNEYTGVWASNIPIIIDYCQQGKECLMTFPSGVDTSTGGASITLLAPIITGSIPLYDVVVPIEILNNSVVETGQMLLKNDGTVTITRLNAVAFSAGGNAGFPSQSVKFRTV